MKTCLRTLCAVAITFSSVTLGHAASKCALEKSAFDRAWRDHARAEQQYTRLQFQADSRFERGEYRRAMLEAEVETARGNLKAAQQGAVGQGLGCLLAPRPTCVGNTISRVSQNIARAKARLKSQEGRLNSYSRAHAQQMTRISERVTRQEQLVSQKKSVMDTKDATYQACMSR